MPDLFCPHCGYAPLIILGGPLEPGNLERIRIECPDCAWPFDREEIERIVQRYGRVREDRRAGGRPARSHDEP